MTLTCCKLVRKGRFVAAEPWLEPGHMISLAAAKRLHHDLGKLAIVQHGRGAGRVVEVLGSPDDHGAVMQGLLAENGLRSGLPRAAQNQVDDLPTEVPFIDERVDLRHQLVVTIDPDTAKDFDDAISLVPAPEADPHEWDLWVHIADVSAYVPADSALDVHARTRAMSAYVPGSVAPMLPHELSSNLCSLRAGVDRGAVSMHAKLDADAEVLSASFHRTVIRSARRLTYGSVDALFDENISIDPVIDDMLRALAAVTAHRRQMRLDRGALSLSLPEVEFIFDDSHTELIGADLVTESASHQLVEECMLIANEAVGDLLATAKLGGIWRVHEHPESASVAALYEQLERLGVPTPPLPESFTPAQAAALASAAADSARTYTETRNKGRFTFVQRVLRALQQAAYQAKPGVHSGLAVANYAHFTSPIRRYPDLVNHRALLSHIGCSAYTNERGQLADIAASTSETERELQRLERTSHRITLAFLLYDIMMSGEYTDDTGEWDGEVVGMISAGMFVRFGGIFEGFVPARTIGEGERTELSDDELAMVGLTSGQRINLGDNVRVYIVNVDRSRGRIDLRLA